MQPTIAVKEDNYITSICTKGVLHGLASWRAARSSLDQGYCVHIMKLVIYNRMWGFIKFYSYRLISRID